MQEEWRSVESNQDYQVSNLGRIRSIDTEKPINLYHSTHILGNTAGQFGKGRVRKVKLIV